jgi:pyruvate,orthophosphate dikinase
MYVYDFDAEVPGGRELLGGKGIGLAEMTRMGVPVPAGFTITTDACRAFMAARELPAGLADEVDEHVRRLEATTGKRFGSSDDPLLVSVRSGAAISMPGMMDTILNLGLNDDAAAGLAARTGNPRFAYDSYRRLIQMFGEVVDGIDPHRFESALGDLKNRRGVRQDTDLTAEDLQQLVDTFKEIYREETGVEFAGDAREQLLHAVRAVFESWDTPRAQVYRRANDIPDDLGTAVNVVQMVFGNKGVGCLRRVPRKRAGRGRGRRHPDSPATRSDAGRDARGIRGVPRERAPARGALPRHAGHRVHRRGREALPPADARGEAHGGGCAESSRHDGR